MVPTTKMSPITVITVVEVVGVNPNGQTSAGLPVGKQTSALIAKGLSSLLEITMNWIWGTKALASSTSSNSSRVFPELEIRGKCHAP